MSARWTLQEYHAYLKRRELSISNVKLGGKMDTNVSLSVKTGKKAVSGLPASDSGISEVAPKPLFIQQKQKPAISEDGTLVLPHTICLPIAPRNAGPNSTSRAMWAVISAKKTYKNECFTVLMEHFGRIPKPVEKELVVDMRYVFTCKRNRDHDNLVALAKVAIDCLSGIVWVDDKQVRIGKVEQIVERPGLLQWLEIGIRECEIV